MNPTGKGGFRKGDDPRRHILTTEERRRGYATAKARCGQKRLHWIRSRIAQTCRPETYEAYKSRWLSQRSSAA